MKKKFLFLIVSTLLVFMNAKTPTNHGDISNALNFIKANFHKDLDQLFEASKKFEIEVHQAFKLETAQISLLEIRNAFKKTEYLAEQIDPEGIKQRINGAPLPKTEPKVADLNIIEPKGLQTLDELLFSDDAEAQLDEIRKLTKLLVKDLEVMVRYQKSVSITHQMIFQALRNEVVRVMTLGVSGFDTPGSLNALNETRTVLSTILQSTTAYNNLVEQDEKHIITSINKAIRSGIEQINNTDSFESFDRLIFLKNTINPLYKSLLELQLVLGIETPKEVHRLGLAVNYDATNLFDHDFLDKYYYSNLKKDQFTQARKEIGEKLFYDPILSKNLTMSCSSCHDPKLYFTDGKDKSSSNIAESKLQRNAPTLINAVYAKNYFYDLREDIFEKQIKHVVHSHEEFNTDFIELMEKLSAHEEYSKMFESAYSYYGISPHSITNSISHYVESLVSHESQFDQYIRGETDVLPESAKRGFNLFMGKAACGTCHFIPTFSGLVPPLFQESESEVLGVPMTKQHLLLDGDLGRAASGKPLDEAPFYVHSFKTTTVRNVEMTGPYMHNGVYDSLEEVLDFYNKGGGQGLGFDLPYQTLSGDPLDLTNEEITDIIAFMKSLTDHSVSLKFQPPY